MKRNIFSSILLVAFLSILTIYCNRENLVAPKNAQLIEFTPDTAYIIGDSLLADSAKIKMKVSSDFISIDKFIFRSNLMDNGLGYFLLDGDTITPASINYKLKNL